MAKKSQALATMDQSAPIVKARPAWAKDLDDREFGWVTEYLVDLSASNAVRRALPNVSEGSVWDTAYQIRHRPHVVAAIDAAMLESVAGPRQWMVGKLAAMADGDLSEFLEVDKDGKVRLTKAWDDIPAPVRKLFRKVYNDKHGLRIELHDPIKAMELLAKVVPGVVVENVDIKASVTLEALVLGAMKIKAEKQP